MVVFYIRACYRLPSFSFPDNQASHSQDTIWSLKFKVIGQGQRYPSQRSWLISLVFHIRASYRHPSLSFHDNRASHFWDPISPWKFKVKGTPRVQHPVDTFPQCFTSGHPIDSCPCHSITIRSPIPEIQLHLENSRSKVKVKGQGQMNPSQCSIQLTHFLSFTSIGPTIPKMWQIECLIGKNGFKILGKNSVKKNS